MRAHLVVEAHHHVGDLDHILSYDGTEAPEAVDVADDAARILQQLDERGVSITVLQPSHGYSRADGVAATLRLNELMAEYRTVAPDRFLPLGTTEPTQRHAGLAAIEQGAEIGLVGMAWHHRFQGCYIDNRWMWPTLQRMEEHGMVACIHVNPESSLEASWRLQRLATEFPAVTFLAMDAFWSYEQARHVLTTAASTPNVIWDLGGPVCYVSVREWIERNGSTTLCHSGALYGVEGPPSTSLAELMTAGITIADQANVLGANVARAFGLPLDRDATATSVAGSRQQTPGSW